MWAAELASLRFPSDPPFSDPLHTTLLTQRLLLSFLAAPGGPTPPPPLPPSPAAFLPPSALRVPPRGHDDHWRS